MKTFVSKGKVKSKFCSYWKKFLTKPGSSQHLSRLAHEVAQTMSNICNCNCFKTRVMYKIPLVGANWSIQQEKLP